MNDFNYFINEVLSLKIESRIYTHDDDYRFEFDKDLIENIIYLDLSYYNQITGIYHDYIINLKEGALTDLLNINRIALKNQIERLKDINNQLNNFWNDYSILIDKYSSKRLNNFDTLLVISKYFKGLKKDLPGNITNSFFQYLHDAVIYKQMILEQLIKYFDITDLNQNNQLDNIGIPELGLMYVYLYNTYGIDYKITNQNKNDFALKHQFKSGERLLQKFQFYEYDSNRTNIFESKRKDKPHLKRLKNVVNLLLDYPEAQLKAKEELESFEKIFNNTYIL